MPWQYRVTKCEVCGTRAVVMTSAKGVGLCAKCGSDPDGVYYEDAARSTMHKVTKLIGEQAAADWWEENIIAFPMETWKTISEIIKAKLDSLECTCREDKNATCPACVQLLRSQEVEA